MYSKYPEEVSNSQLQAELAFWADVDNDDHEYGNYEDYDFSYDDLQCDGNECTFTFDPEEPF